MNLKPEDIGPRPGRVAPQPTEPLNPPIYLSSVYRCENPTQADAMLGGQTPGHVYIRDGHPNAELLAEKCRLLHGAERAAIVASGMSALAVALLAHCRHGDRIIVGRQLYGRSHRLLIDEAARLGVTATQVETTDLAATAAALGRGATLLVVETITNPLLRVADLTRLAGMAHAAGARLVVDNTFASPALCQPLALGADLVVESLTKIMNGHSDVLLGLLCGREAAWARVPGVIATWGFTAAPFDCWLAERGLGTLHLRMERAAANALAAAKFLCGRGEIESVSYPGLSEHPDHRLAERQLGGRFGSIVAFTLHGGAAAATQFIAAAKNIPFCPSLGELSTTLTHPESTSHRGMPPADRQALGIHGGTIRLSVGVESPAFVLAALAEGVDAVAT